MEIIAFVAFIGSLVFVIVGNIIRILMWIKCRKVSRCPDNKCPWYLFCLKGHETITMEEIEEVCKLIEEHKKKGEG